MMKTTEISTFAIFPEKNKKQGNSTLALRGVGKIHQDFDLRKFWKAQILVPHFYTSFCTSKNEMKNNEISQFPCPQPSPGWSPAGFPSPGPKSVPRSNKQITFAYPFFQASNLRKCKIRSARVCAIKHRGMRNRSLRKFKVEAQGYAQQIHRDI